MAHMNNPASMLWETEPYDPRPDWEEDPLPTSAKLRVLEGRFLLAEFDEEKGGPGLDPYYTSTCAHYAPWSPGRFCPECDDDNGPHGGPGVDAYFASEGPLGRF